MDVSTESTDASHLASGRFAGQVTFSQEQCGQSCREVSWRQKYAPTHRKTREETAMHVSLYLTKEPGAWLGQLETRKTTSK